MCNAGCLGEWFLDSLVDWMANRLEGRQVERLVGYMAGRLSGWQAGRQAANKTFCHARGRETEQKTLTEKTNE